MGRPRYKPSETEEVHARAFVDAFVASRYRERLRSVLPDLYEIFCHQLIDRWIEECAIKIPNGIISEQSVLGLITGVSGSPTAVYLGSWHGAQIREYPLPEAISLVCRTSGAVASVEAGEIAYYQPELDLRGAHYLLVRDPARRRIAQRAVESRSRQQSGKQS